MLTHRTYRALDQHAENQRGDGGERWLVDAARSAATARAILWISEVPRVRAAAMTHRIFVSLARATRGVLTGAARKCAARLRTLLRL